MFRHHFFESQYNVKRNPYFTRISLLSHSGNRAIRSTVPADKLPPETLKALLTKDSSEPVEDFWRKQIFHPACLPSGILIQCPVMQTLYDNKKTDMYYRFSWDSEPTDEQLFQLAEEVAEKVREQTRLFEMKHQQWLHNGFKQEQNNGRTE